MNVVAVTTPVTYKFDAVINPTVVTPVTFNCSDVKLVALVTPRVLIPVTFKDENVAMPSAGRAPFAPVYRYPTR